jgi:uncharacterized protein involved in exopolysaccharide biosynthesis
MYEIRRIFSIVKKYHRKLILVWLLSLLFSMSFYFISDAKYKSEAQVAFENTRKPWSGFKAGSLPVRFRGNDEEKSQSITIRDPFWNFLYDQLEKSTYDFTPFFYARTTVYRVMDDVGCRQHFDNGNMDSDEIVLAFTDNLDVHFDRVSGIYDISYKFIDQKTAKAIVERYSELFIEYVSDLTRQMNAPYMSQLADEIARLETEIQDIETQQVELKQKTGIIAPAEFLPNLTAYLYTIEMRLVQAQSRMKASADLIRDSERNISQMQDYATGKSDIPLQPVKEILSDPLLSVLLIQVFWESMNLTQAEMKYLDETSQVKYWNDRLESSKRVLAQRITEDEKSRMLELVITYTQESAKALWLSQHKMETEWELNSLPEIEKEFVYLHRKRLAKLAMLANFRDLQQSGENYISKGEKIGTILDPAYLPVKKSEPKLWMILFTVLFSATTCCIGWFFIRENIEIHSGLTTSGNKIEP